MPINLISDPWLPVWRLKGGRGWIRPADIVSQVADNPVLALDFPRPDWNAAVTESLIGLLACVIAPEDNSEWAQYWRKPPTPDQLAERLAPLAFAFGLGGEGPRCFQDLDPLANCDASPIGALLIDAPGANTLLKNADLFVKRTEAFALCPAYAAAALVTMQTYAPAGGSGIRTSMRGGGPLTTLPVPKRVHEGRSITTLWDMVWASVPTRGEEELPEEGNAEWSRIFPWLAAARTSENSRSTLPEDPAHPLQCYFGMPRRIRLSFSPGGECSFGGPAASVAADGFRQKNLGVKYDGWVHPLSPYYTDKNSGKLPYHPQPGGATYRDWLSWVSGKESEVAKVLRDWPERLRRLPRPENGDVWRSGVLARGFDMDNMKARGWLEARIPFFDPPPDAGTDWFGNFYAAAHLLVAGASEAGTALRYRLRLARFGTRDQGKETYNLPKNSPGKNAFDDVYESFWRETEPDFLDALGLLRDTPTDQGGKVRESFCKALRRKALTTFDEIAGTDSLADQDVRRIVEARTGLVSAFGATGSVRKALGIMTAEAQAKANERRKAKKKEAA